METDEKIHLKRLLSFFENKGRFLFSSPEQNPEKRTHQSIQQKQMDAF
jgi:hypothetical protein